MSAQQQPKFLTPDEYLTLERASAGRSEYLSGEMVAMLGASNAHEIIVINLAAEVRNALRGKPCQPRGGNLRVRAQSSGYFYPDLSIVCGAPEFADAEYLDTLLNPTALFEILSPSSESYDRGQKFHYYRQIPRLEYYVLIRQDAAQVEIYSRQDNRDWLIHQEDGLDASFTLEKVGLTVVLADLYDGVELKPLDEVLAEAARKAVAEERHPGIEVTE